ncbi:MAG: hypothetical protein R3322_15135 [Kiloniellales bacterium]|nr:hypothetical protein [Kiloniellales bacterium]
MAANRINAAKSTGPRGTAGKARASRNALIHGVRAKTMLLPGEDVQDLCALRESLHQEFLPRGPQQDEWFEVIVDGFWRLRRCRCAEGGILWSKIFMRRQLKVLADLDSSQPDVPNVSNPDALELGLAFESALDSLGKLSRYETSIIRRIERASQELKRLQGEKTGKVLGRDNVIDLDTELTGEESTLDRQTARETSLPQAK